MSGGKKALKWHTPSKWSKSKFVWPVFLSTVLFFRKESWNQVLESQILLYKYIMDLCSYTFKNNMWVIVNGTCGLNIVFHSIHLFETLYSEHS